MADSNIVALRHKNNPEMTTKVFRTKVEKYEAMGWEVDSGEAPKKASGSRPAKDEAGHRADPPAATGSGAGASSTTTTKKEQG